MSLSSIENLQQALAAFEKSSLLERKAAASLALRFAKQVELSEYTEREQYAALAVAASRRTPQDLQVLEDLERYSTYDNIRKVAKEERHSATSLFGGSGRRVMPSEAVADI